MKPPSYAPSNALVVLSGDPAGVPTCCAWEGGGGGVWGVHAEIARSEIPIRNTILIFSLLEKVLGAMLRFGFVRANQATPAIML
jgi:hypothetical protein